MTFPAGRPGAVVLLLAAGLVAALFAVAAFTPPGTGAQNPSPLTPPNTVAEVDGGRAIDEPLTFRVYPPTTGWSSYLELGNEIEITFPTCPTTDSACPTGFILRSTIPAAKIGFSGSGDDAAETPLQPTSVTRSNSTLTLTIPSDVAARVGLDPVEHLVIAIEGDNDIIAPEIPRGFEDPEHRQDTDRGYPVEITFTGSTGAERTEAPDNNFIVVKNPISSTVPNAQVRVDLFTYADAEIGPGQEITVDFSGPSADSEFVVPASIATSRVTIDPKGETSFSPSDILVQGARVILTIPTGTTTTRFVPEGEYEIRFSQSARIRNPFTAGNQVITVSSTAPGDETDEITAVIRRTTTVDPQEGPRGTEFELEGKGYAKGTVTIYHDADTDEEIDAGETLASVNTVRGAFSVDLEARGQPDDLEYRVRTRDSEGVEDEVTFHIESSMFFNPPAARVGWPLLITVSDWQDPKDPQGPPPKVAAVSVGGEIAYFLNIPRRYKEYEHCFEYTGVFPANSDKTITLEIEVPPNVPEGMQTVSLYGYDNLEHYRITDDGESAAPDKKPCGGIQGGRGALVSSNVQARLKSEPIAIIKATLDIDTSDLTLSPAEAARGQKVTITGSGFTRAARGDDHIDSVWIGGKRVVDDHSGFEVGSNGDIAFPVTVPLNIPNGPNEVRIEGTDHTLGQAVLTIPQAAISLDPPMGQRGTDITITGSGFIANSLVFVTYGAGVGAPPREAKFGGLLADSRGGFELIFQVPITAEVGKRHVITAVAEEEINGDTVSVEAEASHLIPRADITTTPDSVSPGERLRVLGQHLPPFTLVGPISIAGIGLSLGSQLATDEEGNFETEVLIPYIDYGDHTLLIQVAGVIVPHIVTLAPPPLSGPPDQVFKYLIRDGALSAVWSYDNATQTWSVFDPSLTGEMAALNDLEVVDRGDIVWVNLLRPQRFQDAELLSGWNLIRLE